MALRGACGALPTEPTRVRAHGFMTSSAWSFDVEAPGAFNEDPRWHGFDRIGAMLSVAPSHIERYIAAADVVGGARVS